VGIDEASAGGKGRNRRTGRCRELSTAITEAIEDDEGRVGSSGKKKPSPVRGPGGPANQPASMRPQLEKASMPVLMRLTRVPRWLLVVGIALCLFVGLVLPRSLSWLGGILLLIVAFFLGWLLALSWPVLNGQSKFLRTLIVIVVVLLALFKFVGIL
jgi:hypothetical protein